MADFQRVAHRLLAGDAKLGVGVAVAAAAAESPRYMVFERYLKLICILLVDACSGFFSCICYIG